jgi:hypothetical protein
MAVQRFLLFYAGVFALVALTASVGAGLAAADRVIMSAGGRIAAQAAHRAASFAAVVFLGVHIATEVLAGRSRAAGAVVPFTGQGRAFYLGVGTVATDLLVLVVVTGLLRGRFAGARRAWPWRALHGMAYACWLLAIVHGLMAGRAAKPYVDWSYGGCVAVVALALVFRAASGPRVGETAASAVEVPPAVIPAPAAPPAAAPLPGAGGPGLLTPGFPHMPAPGFAPAPPRMPEGTGAWGRRALPAPGGTARPGQDDGAATVPDWAGPQDPGHPGHRHPGRRHPGHGHPGHGHPGYGHAGHGWPGHVAPGWAAEPGPGWTGPGEPAQAPGPGDGGR